MKKVICFMFSLLLLLSACSHSDPPENTTAPIIAYPFTVNENGNLVSEPGVEYEYLTFEVFLNHLCTINDLVFLGYVQDEDPPPPHLTFPGVVGVYALPYAQDDNILIRYTNDFEWGLVYRKTSLPEFDFALDNIVRLEYVPWRNYRTEGTVHSDAVHAACGEGITDKAVISEFLSVVRSQQDPIEAGLYDLARGPDGKLQNCYVCGTLYGFFAEEPNVAVSMSITSYNDLAYSILIPVTPTVNSPTWDEEHVLPNEWLRKLQSAHSDSAASLP